MKRALNKASSVLLLLFASSAIAGPDPVTYLNGVLNRESECESSYFTFADMEAVSEKVKLPAGKSLGKFCEKKENQVVCKVERPNRQEDGGWICPSVAVDLTPTLPLSAGAKKALLDQSILDSKEKFKLGIPKAVLDSFEKSFPKWVPPLMREGDFPDYDPRYRMTEASVLRAPVSYTSQGKTKNEWVWVLSFFTDPAAAEAQKFSWAVFSQASGKMLHSALSKCNETGWPYLRQNAIGFTPTSSVKTVLKCWNLGPSDAASQIEWILNESLEGSKVPTTQKTPVIDSPHWVLSIEFEEKKKDSVLAIIDGPANLRAKPGSSENQTGECQNDSFAVIDLNRSETGKIDTKNWSYVFCDGKEGWTHRKNLKPFPSR